MNLIKLLRNEWTNLESQSIRYMDMLSELDRFKDCDEDLIETTTVYILIEEKLKEVHRQQSFYEQKLRIFD